MRNYFVSGSWNVICDVCGFKFKNHMLKQRWDGRMVCKDDYEVRHPADLLRVPKDDPSIEWSRPENDDKFVAVVAQNDLSTGTDTLTTQTGETITVS